MAETDIAKLTFQVDNVEGLKRIQEIDRSLKQAGSATEDFYGKIQLLAKSLASFKIFDTLAKGSNDLQQSARRLAVSISTSNNEAKKFTESIRSWIFGIGELNPRLGQTAATLRQLETEFTMTRSQAAAAIGDISSRLRSSFDSTALQEVLSFLPQATQNWAVYIGRMSEAQQIQDAFVRALTTGMTRGLTRYGIQIETQSDAFKQLVSNIERTTGATGEYARRLAVMQKLMEQTSKAEGAFAEQSDTLANQWDSLKNNLKEIKNIVADLFGKFVSPIVKAVNNVLTPQVKTLLGIILTIVTKSMLLNLLTSAIGKAFVKTGVETQNFNNAISKSSYIVEYLEGKINQLPAAVSRAVEVAQVQIQGFIQNLNISKAEVSNFMSQALKAKAEGTSLRLQLPNLNKVAKETTTTFQKLQTGLGAASSAAIALSSAIALIPAKAGSKTETIQKWAIGITSVVVSLDALARLWPIIEKAFAGITTAGLIAAGKVTLVAGAILALVYALDELIHEAVRWASSFDWVHNILEKLHLDKYADRQGGVIDNIGLKLYKMLKGVDKKAEESVDKTQQAMNQKLQLEKESLESQLNLLTEKAKTFFTSLGDELQQLLAAANESRSTATTAIYAQSVEALQYRTMKTDRLAMEVYKNVGDRALQKSSEISTKISSVKNVLESIDKKMNKSVEFNEYTFQQ